jgi:hypothetical protein
MWREDVKYVVQKFTRIIGRGYEKRSFLRTQRAFRAETNITDYNAPVNDYDR